ncbi:hypothetical protein I3842_06G000400 [Carya illinoinensis]|uniref:Uncharacterized protein n=1 Tax=Carya illinoinensis TaxID=32201 RepID=A0A922ERP7_CARIL|nr:hypothetical protein I3842_06G000400 [Carya illinoinensis]
MCVCIYIYTFWAGWARRGCLHLPGGVVGGRALPLYSTSHDNFHFKVQVQRIMQKITEVIFITKTCKFSQKTTVLSCFWQSLALEDCLHVLVNTTEFPNNRVKQKSINT